MTFYRLLALAVCAACPLLLFIACSPDSLGTDPNEREPGVYRAVLSEHLSDYEIIRLDVERLLAQTADREMNRHFKLDLRLTGHPEFVFQLSPFPAFTDDYRAFDVGPDGTATDVTHLQTRFDALAGHSYDGQISAVFTVTDIDLEAQLVRHDQEWMLQALRRYVPAAAADEYLLYRLADVKNVPYQTDHEMVLPPQDHAAAPDDAGTDEQAKNNCRELEITYVADHALYQEFWNNEGMTRTWCNRRMISASSRYWHINNYRLYFRLRNSYVLTWSGNEPTSSRNNGNTALREWRNWGNDNSITLNDCNILFSGGNYEGVVGSGYQSTVCRNPTWAFGFVERDEWNDGYLSKVTAHEVGHTIGARHRDDGFMEPGVMDENTVMTWETQVDLNTHLNEYSDCLTWNGCRESRGF